MLSAALSILLAWLIRQADGGRVLMQLKTSGTAARVNDWIVEAAPVLDGAREALAWDYVFIANYLFLFWICLKLIAVRVGPQRERAVLTPSWSRFLPAAVAALDLAENRAVKAILDLARARPGEAILDGKSEGWLPLLLALAAAATFLLAAYLVFIILRGAMRARRNDAPDEIEAAGSDGKASLSDVLDKETEALGIRPGQRPVGLALSGGGIRSATFNLGLLQSFARANLLGRFHFLSTVSGGGYIGAWLHKWIDNEGTQEVVKALADEATTQKPEPSQITHLRNYSNYLTPRLGLLSADTWATVATYLRNFLLNLVILVCLGGSVLLLPRAAADTLQYLETVFAGTRLARLVLPFDVVVALPWAGLAFFALAFTGVIGIGINLAGAVTKTADGSDNLTSQGAVQINTVAPLVASAVFGAYWLGSIGADTPFWKWCVLTPIAYILPWLGSVLVASFISDPEETREIAVETDGGDSPTSENGEEMARRLRRVWVTLGRRYVGWALLVGLISGPALWGLTQLFTPDGEPWSIWRLITFGPPALMLLFTLMTVLHIGLLGRSLEDHLREWLARAGAWILIYSLGWLALTGASIYGPVLLAAATMWLKTCLAGGWLAASIWGAMAGNAQQQGTGKAWHGPALRVVPWIFVIGLTLSLSSGLDAALSANLDYDWKTQAATEASRQGVKGDQPTVAVSDTQPKKPPLLGALVSSHETLLDHQLKSNLFWLVTFVLALTAVGLSLRVAINEFSMHQYYRNRLVRAYLGASNPNRTPNPFTGFDPADDGPLGVPLRDPDPESQQHTADKKPFHLISAALNLVHGSRLGWQERKAAAFSFSPFHSGFTLPADEAQESPMEVYRETSKVKGLTLGTAMAISGAAASPNMGFRSTPALTLLLTVFNVRLGWWLGNPGYSDAWERGRPRFSLVPLLSELFGLTSERSQFVYLSDGGHFENLGIYELVRRRCRFIVASDASADPQLDFPDLGNAIRKCRTDFGVEIEINVDTLKRGDDGLSRRHCAVGKIHYPAGRDGSNPEVGYLLYVKPTLTGDEPEDLQQYSRADSGFPHQSTGDQFFDESQFESYRALGEHIGWRSFAGARSGLSRGFPGWETLITAVRERWVEPSLAVETSFSRHGETLDRLFERMGADDNLRFLDSEMYPEWEVLVGQAVDTEGLPDTPDRLRSGFYLCSSLLQLMENVYLDLRLDDEYRHPDNRGWINLFRQWSKSPMMVATFALSAGTYGSRFQTFCRRRFGLEMGRVTVEAVAPLDEYLDEVRTESSAFATAIKARLVSPPDKANASPPRKALSSDWLRFTLEVDHPAVKLPVGIGYAETWEQGAPAVQTRFLVYFQIHEHLRNTGLARRGLKSLSQTYPNVIPIGGDDRLDVLPDRRWIDFVNFFWRAQE